MVLMITNTHVFVCLLSLCNGGLVMALSIFNLQLHLQNCWPGKICPVRTLDMLEMLWTWVFYCILIKRSVKALA